MNFLIGNVAVFNERKEFYKITPIFYEAIKRRQIELIEYILQINPKVMQIKYNKNPYEIILDKNNKTIDDEDSKIIALLTKIDSEHVLYEKNNMNILCFNYSYKFRSMIISNLLDSKHALELFSYVDNDGKIYIEKIYGSVISEIILNKFYIFDDYKFDKEHRWSKIYNGLKITYIINRYENIIENNILELLSDPYVIINEIDINKLILKNFTNVIKKIIDEKIMAINNQSMNIIYKNDDVETLKTIINKINILDKKNLYDNIFNTHKILHYVVENKLIGEKEYEKIFDICIVNNYIDIGKLVINKIKEPSLKINETNFMFFVELEAYDNEEISLFIIRHGMEKIKNMYIENIVLTKYVIEILIKSVHQPLIEYRISYKEQLKNNLFNKNLFVSYYFHQSLIYDDVESVNFMIENGLNLLDVFNTKYDAKNLILFIMKLDINENIKNKLFEWSIKYCDDKLSQQIVDNFKITSYENLCQDVENFEKLREFKKNKKIIKYALKYGSDEVIKYVALTYDKLSVETLINLTINNNSVLNNVNKYLSFTEENYVIDCYIHALCNNIPCKNIFVMFNDLFENKNRQMIKMALENERYDLLLERNINLINESINNEILTKIFTQMDDNKFITDNEFELINKIMRSMHFDIYLKIRNKDIITFLNNNHINIIRTARQQNNINIMYNDLPDINQADLTSKYIPLSIRKRNIVTEKKSFSYRFKCTQCREILIINEKTNLIKGLTEECDLCCMNTKQILCTKCYQIISCLECAKRLK